jgi:hypothetical protein
MKLANQRPHVEVSGTVEAKFPPKLTKECKTREQEDQTCPQGGKPVEVNIPYTNIGESYALNVITHRHILFGSQFKQ